MVVEKRTRAGRTITVQQYRKPGRHKGKREKGEGITTQAQKAGNMRRAVLQLTWLMNTNFQDGDYLVTLDYKKEARPRDRERMNKDFTNFWDRLNRRRKKLGLPPAIYIRVMEIGKKGARHHHMMLPQMDVRLIQECWTAGGINIKPLYTDGNYRGVAEYFVKYAKKTMETEGREMKKLWYPSKGLKRAKEGEPKDIKSRELGQIKIPKGFYLDQESVKQGISEFDGYGTCSYILVKIPGWNRGKKKRKKKGGSRSGG